MTRTSMLLLVTVAACGGPAANVDPSVDGSTTTDPTVDASPGSPDAGDIAEPDGGVGVHGYVGAYKSPTIVRDGSTYQAYFAEDRVSGAQRNIPHATFTADGNWTFVGDALPDLGTGAVRPVWAPAVAKINDNRWMLYYTAKLDGTVSKKCIWRARSTNPDGPFVDDYGGPLVCLDGTLWAIDPYVVQNAAGSWFLAARLDQPGGINTVQVRELGPLGAQFADGSSWSELVHNAPSTWEQPVLENAGVVRLTPPNGDPHWFVFYSGGAWDDNSYGVGYADCGTSINGPCTKKTPNGPWLGTNAAAGVFGPGTPTFYDAENGDTMMSVQAWQYSGGKSNDKNDGQIMRTYKMTVDNSYVPHAALVRIDL